MLWKVWILYWSQWVSGSIVSWYIPETFRRTECRTAGAALYFPKCLPNVHTEHHSIGCTKPDTRRTTWTRFTNCKDTILLWQVFSNSLLNRLGSIAFFERRKMEAFFCHHIAHSRCHQSHSRTWIGGTRNHHRFRIACRYPQKCSRRRHSSPNQGGCISFWWYTWHPP